jgi:TonB family protein
MYMPLVRLNWLLLVVAFQFGISTSANAFSEYFGEFSGWDVVGDGNSCGMMMEYEGKGNTSLTLILYVDGSNGISINNSLWSIEDGRKYEITYAVDQNIYSGGPSVGVRNGTPGFVTKFDAEFITDFAAGKSLRIWMDDKLVDQLSLAGSANALAGVRRCLTKLQRKIAAAEAEEKRWSHISDDPFGELKRKESANQPALPKGNPGMWITTNDYPSRALQENREGIVVFRLAVGSDGKVKSCTIAQTSGHEDLDTAACSNVTRRARFSPATDANGNPIDGVYENRIRWGIPASLPSELNPAK